jgi:hypothetical protein
LCGSLTVELDDQGLDMKRIRLEGIPSAETPLLEPLHQQLTGASWP